MKLRLLSFLITLATIANMASAQVTNYALQLNADGSVDCGATPQLNGATSYTLQMWVNVADWTEDANLLSCGDALSLKLGERGALKLAVGETTTINIKSNQLQPNKWAQITIVADEGTLTALINGAKAETSPAIAPQLSPDMSNAPIKIGGNFTGRIDEVRIWTIALDDYFDYFRSTTLNQFNPYWEQLAVYYKFDQDLCSDVVDYKSIYTASRAYNNHGVMTSGVSRTEVTDNDGLPYLLNGAYTANERFFDRGITREQYLLSNDLIILGIQSYSDGHLRYVNPNCHAEIVNATLLESFEGRKGVMSFDGSGYMNCGKECLIPEIAENGRAVGGYTFETWLYIDEWVEGAYIFRKETEDGEQGFSISLGKDDTKQVVVRCNGNRYVNQRSMPVGKWVHFAVVTMQGSEPADTYLFYFNDKSRLAAPAVSDKSTDYTPKGNEQCDAIIGEGFKGKLDETAIWNTKSVDPIAHQNRLPRATMGCVLTAQTMMKASALFTYDNAELPGWDSYSQDEWRDVMLSAYEGYRGQQVRISVKSHSGWLNTIGSKSRREIFAGDLARLAEGYDGVELDLEWCESAGYWNSYGSLISMIRDSLPADKSFMVSCHGYSATYQVPKDKMGCCDGFTFQNYGPQSNWFNFDTFKNLSRTFMNWGFEKSKIYMSYSTTTSAAYKNGNRVGDITGIRNGFFDNGYQPTENSTEYVTWNGADYYITGPRQTYNRAKYVTDNNLQGIFYWDMGNDYTPDHEFSLARWASYGLNANVDTLVTNVDIRHIETSAIALLGADNAEVALSLTPTQVHDQLTVKLSNALLATVELIGMNGSTAVATKVGGDAACRIEVSHLTPGYYVVKAVTTDGRTLTGKIRKS